MEEPSGERSHEKSDKYRWQASEGRWGKEWREGGARSGGKVRQGVE
jgi:hypothetical protein